MKLRRSHLLTVACLSVFAFTGAPCTIGDGGEAIECEDDSDCDLADVCDDGACEPDGAEGEGEGEGVGLTPAEIAQYCAHVSECLAEEGQNVDAQECIRLGTEQNAATSADPSCGPYNATIAAAVECMIASPCEELLTGNDGCAPLLEAAGDAQQTCVALNTGEGEGEGEGE